MILLTSFNIKFSIPSSVLIYIIIANAIPISLCICPSLSVQQLHIYWGVCAF